MFKQHQQNVENHYKCSRCANVFELVKLQCKKLNIHRLKYDRTPKRKRKLKERMVNQVFKQHKQMKKIITNFHDAQVFLN